jgi:hypothetical protein
VEINGKYWGNSNSPDRMMRFIHREGDGKLSWLFKWAWEAFWEAGSMNKPN